MKRNPATLAHVARALHGPNWQAPLGSTLGVDPRTIRRWMSGEFDIPDGVWPDLARHCEMQAGVLTDLAEKLA